jgi:hypothetical protein
MKFLIYRLIKIHRKFTSAYLLCDKTSLSIACQPNSRRFNSEIFFFILDFFKPTYNVYVSLIVTLIARLHDVILAFTMQKIHITANACRPGKWEGCGVYSILLWGVLEI